MTTTNQNEITIKEITSKRELRSFVQFGIDLYKGNPYYCPPIFFDEVNTFDPKSNPALEVCDFVIYLAYRGGKIVGRIVGIINHRANEAWKVKKCRFGWFDFIDDYDVFKALIDAVAEWGRNRGMTHLNGPVGFTDFDKEGLLIEGFDYNAPMATFTLTPTTLLTTSVMGYARRPTGLSSKYNRPERFPNE